MQYEKKDMNIISDLHINLKLNKNLCSKLSRINKKKHTEDLIMIIVLLVELLYDKFQSNLTTSILNMQYSKIETVNAPTANVSTTPIRAMGHGQCLPLSII